MHKITLKTKQGADAIGKFDPDTEKVVIEVGSILTINLGVKPPNNIQQNFETAKQALHDGNLKELPDGRYEVVKDIGRLSPSAASVIVTGKSGSGWNKWKLGNGQPLNSLRHQSPPLPPALPPQPPTIGAGGRGVNRMQLLRHLVRQIQTEQWQRNYRRRLVGPQVTGWSARLFNYGLINSPHPSLPAHLVWLQSLGPDATAYDPANPRTHQIGKELGRTILIWGGVTRSNIANLTTALGPVVQSARTGVRMNNAPMNSGWTKIASVFSYFHMFSPPQVIWDSRVSLSVCCRLADAATQFGLNSRQLQLMFPDLGWIPGRGGNRPRLMSKAASFLPNGYGSWEAHFAGGQVAFEIAELLNENGIHPTASLDQPQIDALGNSGMAALGRWTPWLVACVLFMDGQ